MNYKIPRKTFGLILSVLIGAVSASAQLPSLLVTDTFENRSLAEPIQQGLMTGPNNPDRPWHWHNTGYNPTSGATGPVVSQFNGRKFANFSGVNMTSASFSDGSSNLSLQASQRYHLGFDLLWLDNNAATADSNAFMVYFNVNNRWANVPATNNIQGFRLGVMATGPNTVTYFIQQKAIAFQDVVRGTVNVDGVIDVLNNSNPGEAMNVILAWDATSLWLKIGETIVYDSSLTPFTPINANNNITGTTYLQFWSDTSRNRGLDNIVLSTEMIPEPSTYALALGGVVLAGAALYRRRKAA